MLDKNSTLLYLDLSGNAIEADGAVAIGRYLVYNLSLKTLCINGNNIGVVGATAIFDSLKRNKILEKLMLGSNKVRLSELESPRLGEWRACSGSTRPMFARRELDRSRTQMSTTMPWRRLRR